MEKWCHGGCYSQVENKLQKQIINTNLQNLKLFLRTFECSLWFIIQQKGSSWSSWVFCIQAATGGPGSVWHHLFQRIFSNSFILFLENEIRKKRKKTKEKKKVLSLVTTQCRTQVTRTRPKYSITTWIITDILAAQLHCVVHSSETVNLYP